MCPGPGPGGIPGTPHTCHTAFWAARFSWVPASSGSSGCRISCTTGIAERGAVLRISPEWGPLGPTGSAAPWPQHLAASRGVGFRTPGGAWRGLLGAVAAAAVGRAVAGRDLQAGIGLDLKVQGHPLELRVHFLHAPARLWLFPGPPLGRGGGRPRGRQAEALLPAGCAALDRLSRPGQRQGVLCPQGHWLPAGPQRLRVPARGLGEPRWSLAEAAQGADRVFANAPDV